VRQAEGPHAGEDSRCEVVSVGAPRYADIVSNSCQRAPVEARGLASLSADGQGTYCPDIDSAHRGDRR